MRIDVNAFLGPYPFRSHPDTTPSGLLQAMDRVAIQEAWVSHLSAIFWRDPMEGNASLYQTADQHPRLRPVPALHPELPGWPRALAEAAERHAPCVRADPTFYSLPPAGHAMRALAAACGDRGLPLLLAVRLEDGRQRHPHDRAEVLPPSAVRSLIRSDPKVRLIVTHADREFVEEVHFGATPAEAERILWDICWIWGPPEDHLAQLLHTVGVERFAFGSGMPMRLPEASVCKLDLLDLTPAERELLDSGNLRRFGSSAL
ncbi:MAG TPA: hypothetical protein VGA78_11620 [Gemmatimonadales bacterium]